MPSTSPQTRHTVTAVIVAHDGAQTLPGLMRALYAQTHAAGRIVAVDTGSRDRSGSMLAELIGQEAVFGMDRATGFGQAVWGALRRAPARRLDDSGQQQVEWVWLLHDDCEPGPETLERLLRAASRDRSVVVLGPKVLDGVDRRVLREAGVAIDRAGRRVTGIDPGEIDQGQHDHNRMVMAVGSAGMLIRRDVWEQLGGFDTHLRFFRDDVDFCWRAHAAGYRVQVVTDAVLYHRELAARRGRVPEGATARRLDRRNALYVLAVNLPLLTMLRTLGGCVAGSLLRAAYFLLTKQLSQAGDQLYALSELFGRPLLVWKARRRRAHGRRQGYSAVRTFIPRGRPLRTLTENILSLLSPQGTGGQHHASPDGSGDEDEQLVEPQSVARRVMANHGVQLFVALLVIALVAQRRILGTSPLGGGALVPAWGSASALWGEYLSGFHAVGVGSAATAPPYVAVVAALATVLGGQGRLAVDVLLLGCVPLAGLTAYLTSRRLVAAPAARMWIAAAYALLPAGAGAVAAGRLGTAAALILVPLVARAAGGMLTAAPRAARSAAWATGLLVALTAAFVPLAWVLATGLVLVAAAGGRWLKPWLRPLPVVNAAIVVVVPFAVLFPWSLRLLSSPSAFLLEAGLTPDGLSSASLRPSALLLLSPGGPGLPPVWVTAAFGLALLGAALHRRVALVVAGWAIAAAGYAAAIAVSRSTVESTVTGGSTAAWPGTALVIAATGLLIAAAPAVEWLVTGLRAGSPATGTANADGAVTASADAGGPGMRSRALAIVALAAVASAPVMAAWFWVAGGVRGPVAAVTTPVLPPFVAASSAGSASSRTLVLRDDGGVVDYSVIRQRDPMLGEPELDGYAPAQQALSRQVAALAAPDGANGGDPGQVLGEFGIQWVLLPSPVDSTLAQRLNAAVGLTPVSSAPAYDLWRVTGPVARARVVGPDGTMTTLPSQAVAMNAASAPAAGGTLVLAEPYGGWTATRSGHALTRLAKPVDGWAQGFVLPAGGGPVSISRDNTARHLSLVAELIALLTVCVLAVPGKRSDAVEAAATEAAAAVAPPEPQRATRVARAPGRRAARDGAGTHAGRGAIALGRTRRPPEEPARRPAGAHGALTGPGHAGPPGAESATAVLSADAGDAADALAGRSAATGQGSATAPAKNWEDILAERDSGAWPALTGGQAAAEPAVPDGAAKANQAGRRPTGANAGWGSVTSGGSGGSGGTGPNAGWNGDAAMDWPTGRDAGRANGLASSPSGGWSTLPGVNPNIRWDTDSAAWPDEPSTDRRADPGPANLPWEPMIAPSRDAAGSPAPGSPAPGWQGPGSPATGPRAVSPGAAERKPAERHSHRGGRHGRPARRIWDRQAKDKDGNS